MKEQTQVKALNGITAVMVVIMILGLIVAILAMPGQTLAVALFFFLLFVGAGKLIPGKKE